MSLHALILYSLLAGVCPLIPLPWVDDWVLGRVRRAAFRRLFRQGGAEPSAAQLAELTTDRSSWLRGCFSGLVLYPIKRIFRKIIFIFTIKDCVDAASRTLHELWLVRSLLARFDTAPAEVAGGTAAFARLRSALDRTLAGTDPRPVEQIFKYAFRHGRRLALDAAAGLGRSIRRVRGRQAREEAVDQLVAAAEARLDAVERLEAESGERLDVGERVDEAAGEQTTAAGRKAGAAPSPGMGDGAGVGEATPQSGPDPRVRALVIEVEDRLLAQRGYLSALEIRFLECLKTE